MSVSLIYQAMPHPGRPAKLLLVEFTIRSPVMAVYPLGFAEGPITAVKVVSSRTTNLLVGKGYGHQHTHPAVYVQDVRGHP